MKYTLKLLSPHLLTIALIFAAIVIACGPGPSPAPASPAPPAGVASGPPAVEKPAWQDRWERVVRAARDEATIRVYTSLGPELRTELGKAFREKYGIDVEYVTARPPELTQKVLSERRAGLYLADVFSGGGALQVTLLKPNGLLEPLEPALILAEVTDAKMWSDGQIPFYDKERTSIGFIASPNVYITRNTDMVKPDEITTYRDLLNPKWKGKLTLQDPNAGGTSLWWITSLAEYLWGPEETRSYFNELKEQELAVTNDVRLQVEWIARGKYPVGIAARDETVQDFLKAGAPIAYVNVIEGTVVTRGAGAVSLANKAPHPNGAIVFVNWLLGKEGQTIFSRGVGRTSARIDVPVEGLVRGAPGPSPASGEKSYKEDERFILASPKVLAMFNEVFGPAGR